MKLAMIGLVALIVGVLGGALFSGNKMKGAILEERAEAATDSLQALVRAEATRVSPDGGASRAPGEATPRESGTTDVRREGPTSPSGGSSGAGDRPAVTTTTFEPSNAALSGLRGGPDDTDPPDVVGGVVEVEALGVEPEASDPVRSVAPDGSDNVRPEGMAAAPAADSVAIQGAMQLARMFSSMKPVDAAAVLQELTDNEVDAILRHMQGRLAGQILGEFEPARAALLSRTVLGGVPSP